jgi:hypothetical protein
MLTPEEIEGACLIEALPAFAEALATQLKADQERWGDTWKHRAHGDQDEQLLERIQDYADQLEYAGQALPVLKIAGGAMINWVRTEIKEGRDPFARAREVKPA